jgi:hypothetical protein
VAVLTRPSGSLRLTAAAFLSALLVSLRLLEGTGLHHCPAHDGPAGLAVADSSEASHHHDGGAHRRDGGGEHASGCTCLGDCQAPQPFLAPHRPFEDFPGQVAPRLDRAFATHAVPRVPHLLPFSIGPPLTT